MKEPTAIERGAGYADALLEQAEGDRVPEAVMAYAAAIMLVGLAPSRQRAIELIDEVWAEHGNAIK